MLRKNLLDDELAAVELHRQLWRSCFGSRAPTIFDIGANHGQTTLAYLAALPHANVVAFEANPALVDELRSLRLNVVHCAVGAPPPCAARDT